MRDDFLYLCRQGGSHQDIEKKGGMMGAPEKPSSTTSREINLTDSQKKLCALQRGDNRDRERK